MAIAVAQFTIVDLSDYIVSATAPSNPITDLLWLDTSVTPNVWERWDGSAWKYADVIMSDVNGAIGDNNQDIYSKINQNTTDIQQANDAISLKADQSTVDEITGTVDDQQAQINLMNNDFNVQISNTNGYIDDVQDVINKVTSYMDFNDTDGLTLGKSNSPLQVTISNDQINFKDNGTVVAYINGQRMFIDTAEILSSIIVGVHQIMKYNADTTVVKFVG